MRRRRKNPSGKKFYIQEKSYTYDDFRDTYVESQPHRRLVPGGDPLLAIDMMLNHPQGMPQKNYTIHAEPPLMLSFTRYNYSLSNLFESEEEIEITLAGAWTKKQEKYIHKTLSNYFIYYEKLPYQVYGCKDYSEFKSFNLLLDWVQRNITARPEMALNIVTSLKEEQPGKFRSFGRNLSQGKKVPGLSEILMDYLLQTGGGMDTSWGVRGFSNLDEEKKYKALVNQVMREMPLGQSKEHVEKALLLFRQEDFHLYWRFLTVAILKYSNTARISKDYKTIRKYLQRVYALENEEEPQNYDDLVYIYLADEE